MFLELPLARAEKARRLICANYLQLALLSSPRLGLGSSTLDNVLA